MQSSSLITRFDHGFLKQEFSRIGRPFSTRALCTVRLSRRLYPFVHGHNLDAVVARHGIAIVDRHRALGDARAIWAFVAALYREWSPEIIAAAVKRVLRTPSLPPQLPEDALGGLPETPGAFIFSTATINCRCISARASTSAIGSAPTSPTTG